MKSPVLAAVFANFLVLIGLAAVAIPAHAANVPCEEMLQKMRATKASAKLSDADVAKVSDLEAKAVERCNADDDARSNKFLADAMKIMGK